ncbi:Acetyltransferase (GNAT) domain-containing protein [bacterium A37T11]|nr:Acetyltransferase (GNAT) domain-containing protein [bacterium A37T11]
MEIIYKTDHLPSAKEVIEVYRSSGIRRPIEDIDRITEMYAGSNLIVTAWYGEQLIGVSRALTDFSYCCYLSDLAVALPYQKMGIGKKLVALTKEKAGDRSTLILIAAPEALDYYPKIGLSKIDKAFVINRAY